MPEDISVIGFDDLQHAAFVSLSLTTVHLPLYEVGVLACEKTGRAASAARWIALRM